MKTTIKTNHFTYEALQTNIYFLFISLCMVLNEVWQNREQSMMGIRNLSVVFGPLVTGMGKQSELVRSIMYIYKIVFKSNCICIHKH